MKKIAVIGAGAWGTAIANLLANNGCQVVLWSFEAEVVAEINQKQQNNLYLSSVSLSSNISATNDFADLEGVQAVFTVVPAQFTKNTLSLLLQKNIISPDTPIVICSKGIENESLELLSQIIAKLFRKNPIAVMSGPNFAAEVALSSAAVTTIACQEQSVAKNIIALLENDNFKALACDDIIGAQIGGAIKNIIAIALGIANGLEMSESAKAALFTRGLNEMMELSIALGGESNTVLQPCVIGDLLLTCNSHKSRNMSLGYALGKGKSLSEVLSARNSVAEGVATTKAAKLLSEKLNLRLNLINIIYDILYNNAPIKAHNLLKSY